MPVQLANPSWSWQPADTSVLTLGFAVGSIGSFLTAILIGALAYGHVKRGAGKEDTEASPLLENGAESKVSGPWWRIIYLIILGFGPLLSCIVVGEAMGSVLFAMVVMHWITMLVLPSLYYVIRSREDESFTAAAIAFYGDVWSRNMSKGFAKSLRGCLLGAPIFLCFVSGYVLFSCKSFGWALCMRNFERPLEKYGFQMHSMPFRILAALYFTLWNPVIEEFFWRVFLNREVGLELGLKEVAASETDAPWHHLWRDIVQSLPSWPADGTSWTSVKLHWGVCVMYASYHTWPMKVLFLSNEAGWLHILAGFLFLVLLGRFFLLLRESPDFGLPAAYVCHVWVDAAFAILCMFEIHTLFDIKPEDVLSATPMPLG